MPSGGIPEVVPCHDEDAIPAAYREAPRFTMFLHDRMVAEIAGVVDRPPRLDCLVVLWMGLILLVKPDEWQVERDGVSTRVLVVLSQTGTCA